MVRRPAARLIAAITCVLCLILQPLRPMSVPAHAYALSLVGAGSTFEAPFLNRAFAAYARGEPITISYQAVGSGSGIQLFSGNKVDFGGTDVPMSGMERALATRSGGPVVQVPVILGGVAVAYNEPKIGAAPLRLDGATLAAIFMGRITSWSDPAIVRLNPGVRLPHDHIYPVHRQDSSGTTYAFTSYLSAVSPAWARAIGWGKAVAWPRGFRGNGSRGVADWVRRHEGAIGYMEMRYAAAALLPVARLRNAAGAFVALTPASVRAAAAHFPHMDGAHASIVDARGSGSYPIASYSWVLLRQRPASREQGTALVRLFRWLTTAGQAYAIPLDYVPLPATARQLAASGLDSIVLR